MFSQSSRCEPTVHDAAMSHRGKSGSGLLCPLPTATDRDVGIAEDQLTAPDWLAQRAKELDSSLSGQEQPASLRLGNRVAKLFRRVDP
jgi:hypothetical protein